MRHKNYYSGTHGWTRRHNDYLPEPYTTFGSNHLEYKRPNSKREYVKLIQFIADHPGLKRKEIIARYYYDKSRCTEEQLQKWNAGDFSWVTYNPSRYFAELLWSDMIDYDTETYKYYVTLKGKNLLEEAYLADMEALVKNK